MFELNSTKNKVKTRFSQQQTKRNNTMLLFNLVRKKAPVSRIMLAEMTGLSATTVSLLVEDLLNNRLVRETGIANTNMRGRKPIMLEVNGSGGYFVIVELLSKGFICSVYDLNCERIDLEKYKQARLQKERISVSDAVRDILKRNGVEKDSLIGINVLYPGVVDSVHKELLSSTALEISDYMKKDEIEKLKQEWGVGQVNVTNTSVVSAYSEYVLNSGIANSTIIEITMDEGVGAGVVVIGDKGEYMHSYQMEVGHMVLERGGAQCKCGNRGCFEALCGVANIIKRVNREAGLSLPYDEEFGADENRDSLQQILQEMERGNEQVTSVMDDVVDMLETVIINTINMVDADYVFLTGILSEILKDTYIEGIQRDVTRLNIIRKYNDCKIQISQLDYEKKRQGAVCMMIDTIFNVSME